MELALDLDASATLAAAGASLTDRRSAQVTDLQLVLHWADLHSSDPRLEPGATPIQHGGDRLVGLGGDGTPAVQELCIHELAIARHTHPASTRATMADALDLRHRLPRLWALVRELACETWVASKVARMSRVLDREQVAIVDASVAGAGHQSPGRILALAEAKIIEADIPGHTARLAEARRRRGVWVSRTNVETGSRSVFARVEPGDAAWIDAMVERIADALLARPDVLRAHHPALPAALDDLSRDELRAIAFGWLCRPDDVQALLSAPDADVPHRAAHSATMYLHLHESAVAARSDAVARVEGLGPMLLEQVTRLLGHAQVTIKPVIDLHEHVSVSAYEFPTRVAERTRLRCVGEVFPYAVSTATMSGRYDDDHPVPYDSCGPPGQTGDHNNAPLSRSHHRAKTHRGYRVRQLGDATYLWTTPHGLSRLVDPDGTQCLSGDDAWMLEHARELDVALGSLSGPDARRSPATA